MAPRGRKPKPTHLKLATGNPGKRQLNQAEPRLPTAGIAAAHVAVGTANFAFVAAVLHQLVAVAADYPEVVAAYGLGNATALLGPVPGGLGVLEFVIAALVANANVIGALIVFRIIYPFVPLLLGSAVLSGVEFRR